MYLLMSAPPDDYSPDWYEEFDSLVEAVSLSFDLLQYGYEVVIFDPNSNTYWPMSVMMAEHSKLTH